MDILLVAILYLILGLIISFTISFLYLRHYRGNNVKFAFHFTVIVFGFVIFFIFLIPFDITTSVLYPDFNFLKFLPIYYLIFGYFSRIIGDVVAPILILINTSGFYTKKEIFKDVLKRFFTNYTSIFKIVFVSIVSIPTLSYYITKKTDIFKIFRTLLLYLNFFPYLEMLYYIGFVCQDLAYSYFRNKVIFRLYYDIWKLGKIYKYYERDRLILISKTQKIEDLKKDLKYDDPEFENHYEFFKRKIKIAQTNLLNFEFFIFQKEDLKQMKLGTNTYKKENKEKHSKELNDLYLENNNNVKNNNVNNNNIDNNINNNNIIQDNEFDDPNDDWIEHMYCKVEQDEEILRKDLGISEASQILESENSKESENDIISSEYKNSLNLKKKICELMTEVLESSNFIQRKSFLLNQKCMEIIEIESHFKKNPNPLILILIILFYIIVFIFEMPWSVYDWIPGEYKNNFFKNISIPFFSIVFYFFIFNYAIIEFRYISGNLIFGKKNSGNVNFYNFISYVLENCDAAFYHSIWVLRKYVIKKNDDNYDYDFFPYYFEVFELPEIKGFEYIPLISMIIILISIFNAAKFSNFKINKKQVILFNENADFFYNEKNLYSNFIVGCLMLIKFKKKIDRLIDLKEEEDKKEN